MSLTVEQQTDIEIKVYCVKVFKKRGDSQGKVFFNKKSALKYKEDVVKMCKFDEVNCHNDIKSEKTYNNKFINMCYEDTPVKTVKLLYEYTHTEHTEHPDTFRDLKKCEVIMYEDILKDEFSIEFERYVSVE